MIEAIFTYSDKQSQGSSNRFATILVTMGHHGVIFAAKGHPFNYFPAIQVSSSLIKSAVGSGDNFMGGFIYGL